MSHDEEAKKGKKGFFNKGKGEEDDITEDNGKDDRKEENDDGASIHSKHKADEGEEKDEKAFYGGSRFEMICNHEDDPKTSNGFFCKVLCGLCEEGGECCIAEHLGCDVSGWSANDQSSFLRSGGGVNNDCHFNINGKDYNVCDQVDLEQSLDRLLTMVGLNK